MGKHKGICKFLFTAAILFMLGAPAAALEVNEFYYGDHWLEGYDFSAEDDDKVTVQIGSKKYTDYIDSGEFSVRIPGYFKIGTAIRVTVYDEEGEVSATETVKVQRDEEYDVFVKYVYPKHKKVKGYVTNAHKGDIVKIKIGKKTYKKTLKKDSKKLSYSIKIKNPKAGQKMRIMLFNRFKQKLVDWKWKVFTSNVVRTGMTKSQVKLLAYWSEPDHKNKSAYSEQWCYDDDGDGFSDAYLYFRNGRVSNWSIKD